MNVSTRKCFNIDEYHRLIDLGFFNEDDHIELIRGEIMHLAQVKRVYCLSLPSISFIPLDLPLIQLALPFPNDKQSADYYEYLPYSLAIASSNNKFSASY